MPIAIANVINAASSKDSSQLQAIYFNAFDGLSDWSKYIDELFSCKYHSTSIRQVEAGLRATLIKKNPRTIYSLSKELHPDESSQDHP